MLYIQVLDRYWNPGKVILEENNATQEDIIKFHKFIANEYKNLIIKAIDDQRYRNKWPALTIGYINYKKRKGYPTDMWIMTGELRKSIRVRKKGSNVFVIGFPNKLHTGTNLTLVELAKILEFGSIRIPPRPLFRLVYRYISSNIMFFYNKFKSTQRRKK